MALITCKNCGKEVSDKAKVCPGCGCVLIEEIPQPEPAEESTPSVRICEECGHEFPYDAESCPNCGCPVEPPTNNKEGAPGEGSSEPQKVEITKVNLPGMKAKAKKIIAIVAVLAVLIAVATVVIIKNNAKKNKEEYMSNLRLASSTMLSGATEAESCGSLIHDVWYNCIFEKADTETDNVQ